MFCPGHFRYLFGEEVDGVAFVVFGIIDGDTKRSIPQSLQRVQVSTLVWTSVQKRKQVNPPVAWSITISLMQHLNRLWEGKEWPY